MHIHKKFNFPTISQKAVDLIMMSLFIQGTLSNTPVITVVINDLDIPSSNNLEFVILSGDPDGIFTIDSNGEIRQTAQLDRETQAGL